MATNRWTPSKGREIEDIVSKINEIENKLISNSNQGGDLKSYQLLGTVKKDNNTVALQFKNADGSIIESDNTSATGFKVI